MVEGREIKAVSFQSVYSFLRSFDRSTSDYSFQPSGHNNQKNLWERAVYFVSLVLHRDGYIHWGEREREREKKELKIRLQIARLEEKRL